jgi:hypothetical protein
MQRSTHSIRAMLHRLGESAQRGRDWFAIYSLAEALHIRSDEVQRWIDQGWLKCRIVETTGVKKRIIDPEDFSDFIRNHGPNVIGRRLRPEGLSFVRNLSFRQSTRIYCPCENLRTGPNPKKVARNRKRVRNRAGGHPRCVHRQTAHPR